ncbi:hypothetical protein [Rugamonas apoptosis]|uniref:Uncharacterized protein n=1 Tax=Rugamonas apoptosis TaxID=2758570 RepID=A0A7W2FCI4_9BURK|nr:hypothetical protein [Rugamonas apoptosis]MBA5689150.1 hypothetical protein [Rugamonas apoptosis]
MPEIFKDILKDVLKQLANLNWTAPILVCEFALFGEPHQIADIEERMKNGAAKVAVLVAVLFAFGIALISETATLGNGGYYYHLIRDIAEKDPIEFLAEPLAGAAILLAIGMLLTWRIARSLQKRAEYGESLRSVWAGILIISCLGVSAVALSTQWGRALVNYFTRSLPYDAPIAVISRHAVPYVAIFIWMWVCIGRSFRVMQSVLPATVTKETRRMLFWGHLGIWVFVSLSSILEHEAITRVHPDPLRTRDIGPELAAIAMTGIACNGNADTIGCVVNINTGQPQDMTLAGTWDTRTVTYTPSETEGPVIARWTPIVANAGMVPVVSITPYSHFDLEIRTSRKEACAIAALPDDAAHPSYWRMRAHAHENGKWTDDSKTTKLIPNNLHTLHAELSRLCSQAASG